mmetsp:Transcript_31074/g.69954  ORF Transcript_31074/g.69954 Transcript_31074/m.69954 type:complete len:246 (+) Transcript_31074:1308-2045(+)
MQRESLAQFLFGGYFLHKHSLRLIVCTTLNIDDQRHILNILHVRTRPENNALQQNAHVLLEFMRAESGTQKAVDVEVLKSDHRNHFSHQPGRLRLHQPCAALVLLSVLWTKMEQVEDGQLSHSELPRVSSTLLTSPAAEEQHSYCALVPVLVSLQASHKIVQVGLVVPLVNGELDHVVEVERLQRRIVRPIEGRGSLLVLLLRRLQVEEVGGDRQVSSRCLDCRVRGIVQADLLDVELNMPGARL